MFEISGVVKFDTHVLGTAIWHMASINSALSIFWGRLEFSSQLSSYRSYKNFTEDQFKEAIISDCSYIEYGNLTSLQHVIEKRLDQFAPIKKIVLRENDKPHMTSQLRKAIIKRSRLNNKANKSGKPADKTQRNFVVKLNKEAKKTF